jgi:hypothetical protein
VPVAVRRAVWARDLGRCAFVGEDGRRCGERGFVQFHHVLPFAAGGEATVQRIELRCGRHNRYEARLFFPRPENRAFVPERNGRGGGAPSNGSPRSTNRVTRSAGASRVRSHGPSPATLL